MARAGNEDYLDWYCSGIAGRGIREGIVSARIEGLLRERSWEPSPWPDST